ncbi:MAG: hypothetical protein LKK00_08655 [Intestinimonas sp.]|jgi:hypothetical protein|nr:hypothetical protein [Intestinimonas sp.]
MTKKHAEIKTWFRLDNAAMIYSAIQRENYSAIYRFSAVMTRPVDPEALQRAVDRTMPRFPGFAVRIRRGAFWYYFEPNDSPGPFVREDINNPCQPVRFREDNGWLIRFFYYNCRISMEVFHALSDGAGSLTLLRTLLAVYLRELGHDIPNGDGVLDVNEPPRPEELEDSYGRYAHAPSCRGMGAAKAYPGRGTPEPFYTLNVTMGLVPLDKLHQVAKRSGASITEYLAAVLIQSLLQKQHWEKNRREYPVALAVPINLRGHFPSQTLRNFVLTVRPFIDPNLGNYTFDEIVAQVHHQMRLHISRQEMAAQITRNVKLQHSCLLKLIPAPIKNLGMKLSYRAAGNRPYSTTYTNPGAFRVPAAMAPHIRRMEVILGQSYAPRSNCASISYENTMEITFAGTVKESDVERDFFRHLVHAGIPVRVESNREE